MGEKLRGDIVRELRKQQGLSKQQLADAIGVARTRIIQIESGIPTTVKAVVFARMLEVLKTKPYILLGEPAPEDEPEEETVNVPVYGYVPCGYLFPCDEDREGYYEICRSRIKHSKPDNLFAVIAKGNSLIGDGIQDGDYLIVDKVVDPFHSGKIYIVTVENETVAKHCYLENNHMKLVSTNGSYQDIHATELQIQGRVILSGKWREH